MKIRSREAAELWATSPPPDFEMEGVAVDSRKVEPGNLFVALTGERADGHEFVSAAFERGARAALVSRVPPSYSADRPVFVVPDPLEALQKLAAEKRRQAGFRLAAVTGSVGKTTTKEMAAAIFSSRFRTGKTEGNLNSGIGVPVAILNLDDGREAVAGEFGMSHAGEISLLSRLFRPETAAITNVSAAHRQNFASVDEIADAKWEILDGLAPEGTLVFNSDDERLARRAKAFGGKKISFGTAGADVSALGVEAPELGEVSFELSMRGETERVRIAATGRHQVSNFLCAAAMALAWGFHASEVAGAARGFSVPERRGRTVALPSGAVLIDDSYNSSPVAARAALAALFESGGRARKIAVLGDMLELGEIGARLHREVGAFASERVDRLICVGKLAREIGRGAAEAGFPADRIEYFAAATDVAPSLEPRLEPGDVVLVKGSRGIHLDIVCDELGG
ncbi:MAG: UDP-N-acetylmuramoyl-tripeptide--D-alanyl-D-alanine ligase [Thermoanaerobaculia bacterium]